ncbi:MAG: hypothetical protein ACJA02_000684 [Myxococcota bacterium]|jgi:hypothetical protein
MIFLEKCGKKLSACLKEHKQKIGNFFKKACYDILIPKYKFPKFE